jgi:predicted nucleic acid-binding protein
VTHVLDSSAILSNIFGEPGANRVNELINDPNVTAAVSVLTLFETYTTVLHRTGSDAIARQAVATLKTALSEMAPISEAIVELAMDMRHTATSRIATVDCLIAATAVPHGAILVHRDPHFGALLAGKPTQEVLPDKAAV